MPDLSRIDPVAVVLLAILVVSFGLAVAAATRTSYAKRAREAASLSAIDFVRTSFVSRLARGEPLDELLPAVVEALRGAMHLDAAEIWLANEGGYLDLTVSEPARAAPTIQLLANVPARLAPAPIH